MLIRARINVFASLKTNRTEQNASCQMKIYTFKQLIISGDDISRAGRIKAELSQMFAARGYVCQKTLALLDVIKGLFIYWNYMKGLI